MASSYLPAAPPNTNIKNKNGRTIVFIILYKIVFKKITLSYKAPSLSEK